MSLWPALRYNPTGGNSRHWCVCVCVHALACSAKTTNEKSRLTVEFICKYSLPFFCVFIPPQMSNSTFVTYAGMRVSVNATPACRNSRCQIRSNYSSGGLCGFSCGNMCNAEFESDW
jgi:hypothetical protein